MPERSGLRPRVKIWVVLPNGTKLGDGRARTFELIDELGSIRKAVGQWECRIGRRGSGVPVAWSCRFRCVPRWRRPAHRDAPRPPMEPSRLRQRQIRAVVLLVRAAQQVDQAGVERDEEPVGPSRFVGGQHSTPTRVAFGQLDLDPALEERRPPCGTDARPSVFMPPTNATLLG